MKTILLLLCLLSLRAQAQHFSNLGRFSIDYERGCSPTTIHISQHDFLDKPRSFSFHSEDQFVSDTSFTYSVPGDYQIIQLIGEDISPKTDTLTFTVYDSPLPGFDIYSCNGDQLEVEISSQNYDYHRVYFTSTDSIDVFEDDPNPQFQYLTSTASIRVKGLFNDSFNQSCGEALQTIQIEPLLFAASIDSAFFSQNCDNTFSLDLAVSNTSNFKYKVEIEDRSTKTELYEGAIGADLKIDDISIGSESEKCISISSLDPCTGESLESDSYCLLVNFTELENFAGAFSSYSGSNIFLHFGNSNEELLKILRKNERGEYTRLANQPANQTVDPVPSSRRYQYQISYLQSNCDTLGNLINLSPPYIRILSKGQINNTITLQVDDPVNKLTDDTFEISLLMYNSDSTETFTSAFDGSFTLRPTLGEFQKIRLSYFYPEHNLTIYSNEISTRINHVVHVPKAFTPDNRDGLNDELMFYGLPSNSGNLQIYNRWGELIYESNQIAIGWNGRSKEGKAPQGSYRYKLSYKTPNGENRSQVGTFVLIRE
ncbi:MAG: gliding motility-associated C-terminal domain-containing protein [Cyclobacteriaceae bacterium]